MVTRRLFLCTSLFAAAGALTPGLLQAFDGRSKASAMMSIRSEYSPIPRKMDAVRAENSDGRAVLILSGAGNNRIVLNETASYIWANINGERTCYQLSCMLGDRFSVNLQRASADVAFLVSALSREGLLNIRSTGLCNIVERKADSRGAA